MKKLLLSLIVVLAAVGTTMAQEQGKIRLGAGLVYGTQAGMDDEGSSKGGIGINVGGEYFFTEKISAAPSFSYFLKSKVESDGFKSTMQVSSLNFDGRYYFGSSNNISFYGLAGIAVGFAKVEIESNDEFFGDMSVSVSDNKVGINIGGGMLYPINEKLNLNAQLKYNTPLEQLALQVGVVFPIN